MGLRWRARIAVTALAVGAVVVAVTGWTPDLGLARWWDQAGADAGSASRSRPEQPAGADSLSALGVLRAWDRARSDAWAAGDVAALAALYAPGSRAGARDREMLRRYLRRGLRVERLGTQVLAARVLRQGATTLVLLVTDRTVGGVVVGVGLRVRLPEDRATTHRISLVRVGSDWLVRQVAPEPAEAPAVS